MSTIVREILDRIMKLPEPERMELRAELARQEEREWAELSAKARKLAEERGLDDDGIAQMIESGRYKSDQNRG